MNNVIKGKHRGYIVSTNGRELVRFNKSVKLNNNTVSSIDILNQQTSKSGASAVGRGAVGGLLLGPIGLLGGAISAKNKTKHLIRINYTDGGNSIVEVNDKVYNNLILNLG